MAVKSSGPISMQDLAAEFGGSAPYTMSQFYRGAGRVPTGPTANNGISTSGAITMSGFYGSVKGFVFNPVISADTQNYNIRARAVAAGWDGVIPLLANITINSGIYVGSTSTGSYAFDTDLSFPAGSVLTLANNGFIVGTGGNGGANAAGGGNGGPALRAQFPITINNAGTIGGGGGGGGGGAPAVNVNTPYNYSFGGGGGGGAGYNPGSPGPGSSSASWASSAGGAAGTRTAGGGGGAPGAQGGNSGGWGGSGGGLGQNGSGGGDGTWTGGANRGYGYPGAPGTAGAAVTGNGNITWTATGTRLGTVS